MSTRTRVLPNFYAVTQAIYRLEKNIRDALTGLTDGAGLSTVLFVDQNSPGPGERGSLVNKFPTIQSAVNASQSGDLVLIAPGMYAENIMIPNRAALAIIGLDISVTIVGSINYAPTAAVDSFSIQNVRIENAGNPALTIDGSNADFQTLLIESVFVLGNTFLTRINTSFISQTIYSGNVSFTNMGLSRVSEAFIIGDLNIAYSNANEPSMGRQTNTFENTEVLGVLFLDGAPKVLFQPDSAVGAVTSLTLAVFPTSSAGTPTPFGPIIDFHGRVGNEDSGGNVTLAVPDQTTTGPANARVNFDHARLNGDFTITAISGTVDVVHANNAVFQEGSATISAGTNVFIDVMQAHYEGSTASPGLTGAVNREHEGPFPLALAAGPSVVVIPGARWPNTNYQVTFEADVAGDFPVTAKTTTDFTVTLSAPANVVIVVHGSKN